MRENKGITLIALAITIIVLLILAGVTIGMITSDNGVIKEAKSTAEESRGASVEEAKDLWLIKREGGGKQDLDGILAELEKQGLLSSSEVSEIKNNANNEIKIGSRTISFKEEKEDTIVKFEPEDPSLWQYEPDPATNGETLILKGYIGEGRPKEMIIPNYINGKPVKKIQSKTGNNASSIWSNSSMYGQGICDFDGNYNMVQSSVRRVYIPDGIEEIGTSTFAYSKALEEVVLPSTLVKIGDRAFAECSTLKEAKISIDFNEPSKEKSVGWYAFGNCTSLTKVDFSGNNFECGGSAFADCINLKTVNLSGIGTIGDNVFENCASLTYIKIPTGIRLTGQCVFDKIPNIVVEEGRPYASNEWNPKWNVTTLGRVTLKPAT